MTRDEFHANVKAIASANGFSAYFRTPEDATLINIFRGGESDPPPMSDHAIDLGALSWEWAEVPALIGVDLVTGVALTVLQNADGGRTAYIFFIWSGGEFIGLRRLQLRGTDPDSEDSWHPDGNYADCPRGLVTFMTNRKNRGYTDSPVPEGLVRTLLSASKKCL